ncbi:MAG: CinA family protein, partial [Actinobacteria bacterium]|nr:CinA family protein [Actinomycetota bacterium]
MIDAARIIVEKLKSRNESIAIAESLTGGGLSSALTEVPGTSHVFLGSIVAYTSDVKVRELGVSTDSISEFGVVSEEVALQMAE